MQGWKRVWWVPQATGFGAQGQGISEGDGENTQGGPVHAREDAQGLLAISLQDLEQPLNVRSVHGDKPGVPGQVQGLQVCKREALEI